MITLSSSVFAGLGNLRVGPRIAAVGSVFGIVQKLTGPLDEISAIELRDRMMKVTDWPARVTTNPSFKQFGSQRWCEDYVVGARYVKNRYFEDV